MLRRVNAWSIVPVALAVVAFAACSGGGGVSQNPKTTASPGATATPKTSPGTTATPSPPASGTVLSWPVFGHDPARSGVDVGDTTFNSTNVSTLVEYVHMILPVCASIAKVSPFLSVW